MAQKFAQSLKVNRGFVPSQPVAGEANDTVYAGKNIVFKGSPQAIHAETFRGCSVVIHTSGSALPMPGLFSFNVAGFEVKNGSDEIKFAGGPIPQAGTSIVIDNELYVIVSIQKIPATVGPPATPAMITGKISPAYVGPDASRSTVTPMTLCAMNDMLAVVHGGGSAISLPQGHILTSGVMGLLYVVSNPAPSGQARVIYVDSPPSLNPVPVPQQPNLLRRLEDGTYTTPRVLGFSVPPPPILAAMAGGTKNMPAGRYSLRISRSSLATAGYGNPSEAVEITITAGQKIEVTFPVPVANQSAWRVFCSLYSVAEGITGPWYEMEEVKETDLEGAAARKRALEWRDYEVAGAQLVTFDNNTPPNARFIAMFGGMPVLVSCYGPPLSPVFTGTSEVQTLTIGGTPTGGTFTLTFEGATTTPITWYPNNATLVTVIDLALEALPNIGAGGVILEPGTLSSGIGTIDVIFAVKRDVGLMTATSSLTGTVPTVTVVQTIAGVAPPPTATTAPGPSVQPGKPYNIEGFPPSSSLAMGPVQNIISFVEGEGRLYLATDNYIHILTLAGNPDQPLTVRPFVQCAIVRHNALVYIEGTLYGFSARGPMRISGEGTGMEDRIFAAPVRAVTEKWKPARVFVAYDPHNESILWIHTNDSQVGGWWRTMVLSYSLTLGIWSTPLYIERPGQHMIITGVATLGSRVFLAEVGGTGELLMWDGPNAVPVAWEMATPFIDQPGVAGAKKNIRHITVTHRGASTDVDVIGISAGGIEPSPFTAAPAMRAAVPGSAMAIVTTPVGKINVKNLRLYLIKLAGINAVADPLPNRVDEIIIDGNVHGPVT